LKESVVSSYLIIQFAHNVHQKTPPKFSYPKTTHKIFSLFQIYKASTHQLKFNLAILQI